MRGWSLIDSHHASAVLRVTRQLRNRGDQDASLVGFSIFEKRGVGVGQSGVSTRHEQRIDRGVGSLVGLACADAIGVPLEFRQLRCED